MYNQEYAEQLREEKKYEELYAYVSQYEAREIPQALNMLATCYYRGYGVEKNEGKCFFYDNKAAELKNPDSIAILGYDYEFGIGVQKNIKEAFRLYEEAAALNSIKGVRYLGRCYQYGIGIDINKKRAVEYYNLAAEQGDAIAQRYLAICYQHAIGVECDAQNAFYWYKKSADQNGAISLRYLGLCYEYGIGVEKNQKEAFNCYKLSAEQGDGDAQYHVAMCFLFGKGVQQDKSIAIKWLQSAVNQGHVNAMHFLAWCYSAGEGVEENIPEAVNLCLKAIELEWDKESSLYIHSCATMAYYYENGIVVEKNEKKAIEYYSIVAEKGEANALVKLAWYQRTGTIINKDIDAAIKGYQLAADKFELIYDKALCYKYIGDCISENEENTLKAHEAYSKAIELFNIAAKEGDGDAYAYLGELHERGLGVSQNLEKAFAYYEKADRYLSNDTSAFTIAECYEMGIGVAINKKKAFSYYQIAAERGHHKAKIYLGYCYEKGIGVKKNLKKALTLYRIGLLDEDERTQKWAKLYLGLCLFHGVGVKEDQNQAFDLLRDSYGVGKLYYSAFKEGKSELFESLGGIYFKEDLSREYGICVDYNRAVYFWDKAFQKGIINEQNLCALSSCYCSGKGVKIDKKRALFLLRSEEYNSIETGKRLRRLAEHYYYGYGTKRNYRKALDCFEKALLKGDSASALYIAFCYANGYGTEENVSIARNVLEENSSGHDSVKAFLGLLNIAGEWGYIENKDKGYEYLESIQGNHVFAPMLELLRERNNRWIVDMLIKAFPSRMYVSFTKKIAWKYVFAFAPKIIWHSICDLFLLNKKDKLSKNDLWKILLEERAETKEELRLTKEELRLIKQSLERNEHEFKGVTQRIDKLEANITALYDNVKKLNNNVIELKDFIDKGVMVKFFQTKVELIKELKKCTNDIEEREKKIAQSIASQIKEINKSVLTNKDIVEEEEQYLIGLFGEKTWNGLKKETRASLKSARVLWRACSDIQDENFDYSGICISLTAALEIELKRVLFFGLQRFITSQHGKPSVNASKWPDELVFGKTYNDSRFITLGSISYLLGKSNGLQKEGKRGPCSQKLINCMKMYLQTVRNCNDTDLFQKFQDGFAEECNRIANSYRNPAAHTGVINREEIEECYHSVLDGKLEAARFINQGTRLLLKLYEDVDIEKIQTLENKCAYREIEKNEKSMLHI